MENNQIRNKDVILHYLKKFSPYLILFILMLFIHSYMGFFGDDIGFKSHPISSLWDYMIFRWNNWSYRVLIESVASIVTKNMGLWVIFDSLFYTIAAYYIIKIVNKNKNKIIPILGICLFLMYPFIQMDSAGWMATTTHYLWPFVFGLLSFIPLINKSYDRPTSIIEYLVAIIGLIYSANHEQSCCLVLGLNILYLINTIVQKRKLTKYNVFAIIITIIALLLFLKCPGTSIRYAKEVANWFPSFAHYGLIEKLYLGTIPTINILLRDKVLFPLFYIMVCTCVLLKTNNKYLKIFAGVNIGLVLSLTIFRPILLNMFPQLNQIFVRFGTAGDIPSLKDKCAIAVIFLSIYLIGSSCFMLYECYDKNIFPPLLFIGGFMTRLLVGFSPTVFASQQRTFIYLDMILILLILMISKKLYEEDLISEKQGNVITIMFILLAFLSYAHTFLSITR